MSKFYPTIFVYYAVSLLCFCAVQSRYWYSLDHKISVIYDFGLWANKFENHCVTGFSV